MLKIWMVDFAREQSPTLDQLYHYATIAQQSGYDAIGLYLEQRFAFAATPWSHGRGAITPAQIQHLQSEFPSLQIIPFINLLGHFEGFLYTEEGRQYREELFSGLQACPSNPKFVSLCEQIIDETIAIFKSNIIHIGGDETAQLGRCPKCQERLAEKSEDTKGWLYGEHFAPLIQRVIAAGRRPAMWGDMFLERPDALKSIPKETLIFDWQYENGVRDSAPKFAGFDVIACPTITTYSAAWMHLERTEKNVRNCAQDAHDLGLAGFCLTTWEQTLFNPYDSIFPAVAWASSVADNPEIETSLVDSFGEAKEWAHALGIELEKMGGAWAASGHRHKLKSRLLLVGNPFLAWLHHREEVLDGRAQELLLIIEKSIHYAPSEEYKNVSLSLRAMIEAVMIMEEAHKHYAAREPDAAISKLAPMRYLFETLGKLAKQNHERIGGSLADIERCTIAKRHIEICIQRIRDYGNGELGYLPAFEVLTNHRFTPHDQACWWLVNKWACE